MKHLEENRELFDFIGACPTAYHTAAECERRLASAGFVRLEEEKPFSVVPGGKYYVTRNGSSLLAFCIPSAPFSGYMIAAVHGDSPAFKLRGNPTLSDGTYLRLSTEKYGGMILSTWLDRPLSIAGRVTVRKGNGFTVKNVNFDEPCVVIPNVAIHMTRTAGAESALNPAVDLVPLMGTKNAEADFSALLSRAAGTDPADILSADLFVYNPENGVSFGDLIAAPRLDDLQSVFGALSAFLTVKNPKAMPVFALFDNEEVGSTTKQGAASTFLADTLRRVTDALGESESEYRRKLALSLMVSCDNAHAKHPNHPEFADKVDFPLLNGGIVIKHNANQRYVTDAVSEALFLRICEAAGVPVQHYSNRPDIPGGSTLGNIANTQVSLNSVDVGLPQLAMHSAMETAGAKDTAYLTEALAHLFAAEIRREGECYHVEC